MCEREKKKKPMREKGVKYIIYLHWQRETNAFTEIEDTSPSLIDTHAHARTHTDTFWLKDWIENRKKLIFLKQEGNKEKGREKVKQEDDGEKIREKWWVDRIEERVGRPK